MNTDRNLAQFQNTDGDSPDYCTHIKFAIIASVTLVSVIFCNIGNQIAEMRQNDANIATETVLRCFQLQYWPYRIHRWRHPLSQASLETSFIAGIAGDTLQKKPYRRKRLQSELTYRPALCTRSVRRHWPGAGV